MNTKATIVAGALGAAGDWTPASGTGAVVVFEGIVRPTENGQPIAGLEYEVYEPMAGRILEQIAAAVMERHGLLGVRAEHSRGFVRAGERSFRLSIAAVHRAEALAAAAEFIDAMKRDAPIWKRPVPMGQHRGGGEVGKGSAES